MRTSIASPVLIASVLVAGPAQLARAADSANNDFRFGAAWVAPDGKTTVDSGGGNVNFDAQDEVGYFVDYERRLIPWLGLDFEALYAKPTIQATTSGGTTTETSIVTWTGSVGVNFHVFARSRVDLYLGVFGSYTDFDQTLDSTYGYGGLVGLDVGLTKKGLILTISARYSETDADFSQIAGSSLPYNPLVGQLGLGWRF
jgi:outer membrane protein W